jgi:SAM-dependent methyltransferase
VNVFDHYSRFYDLLYSEKDYEAECDFLENLWKRYADREIRTILDLGCGTGGHALPLAKRGYSVSGVDMSPQMLSIADKKAESSKLSIHWQSGDIRSVRLERVFDTVISMFAVIGYQTENKDVSDAFKTARLHLKPGSLFIFDVWFGPAVLTDRPTDRIKIVDQRNTRIIRLAEPQFDLIKHTVLVKYTLLCLRGDVFLSQITEAHKMRFYFTQELSYFLSQSDFRVVRFCPFLSPDEEISTSHFNLTVVAEAI